MSWCLQMQSMGIGSPEHSLHAGICSKMVTAFLSETTVEASQTHFFAYVDLSVGSPLVTTGCVTFDKEAVRSILKQIHNALNKRVRIDMGTSGRMKSAVESHRCAVQTGKVDKTESYNVCTENTFGFEEEMGATPVNGTITDVLMKDAKLLGFAARVCLAIPQDGKTKRVAKDQDTMTFNNVRWCWRYLFP